MMNPKQARKRQKQLKAEIQETKQKLAALKKELRDLREEQQHDAVDHLEDYISGPGQKSFWQVVIGWFKK